MGNSLFDQLEKSGLVDEKKAKQAKKEKRKQSKQQRGKQAKLLGPLLEFVVDDLHQGCNRPLYDRCEELNIESLTYSHFVPSCWVR